MNGIRRYEPRDRADVYDVCVRTAAAGGDATGVYSSDALMPDVFAGPYLEFEPDLAFVIDTGERVAGYILGARDTRTFVERVAREWVPAFSQLYPVDSATAADIPIVRMGLEPQRMIVAEIERYPAHLHIDLLPELQGQGWGRRLIGTLAAALAEVGVTGVHLGLDAANTGARAFYDRLGFEPLPSSSPDAPLLGADVRALVPPR